MLKIIILIIVSFLNKDKLILKQILEQQKLSLYKWKELVNHLFLFKNDGTRVNERDQVREEREGG